MKKNIIIPVPKVNTDNTSIKKFHVEKSKLLNPYQKREIRNFSETSLKELLFIESDKKRQDKMKLKKQSLELNDTKGNFFIFDIQKNENLGKNSTQNS